MADNIIVSERNTLPVLNNINVSTVILPPHQHYIYIILYIYFYNMKPYNERKMKAIGAAYGSPSKLSLAICCIICEVFTCCRS